MIDIDFQTTVHVQQGTLLIAEPFADDDFFRRAVILICDHNEKGTFGLVLNNYMDVESNDLSSEKLIIDSRISLGGPVDTNNLYFIHSYGHQVANSIQISEDLFLGGDFSELIHLLRLESNPEQYVRFFLGYSGWGENQLKEEIKNKYWAVAKLDPSLSIMDTQNPNLWDDCLSLLGSKFAIFKNFPIDPNNN